MLIIYLKVRLDCIKQYGYTVTTGLPNQPKQKNEAPGVGAHLVKSVHTRWLDKTSKNFT